MAASAGLSGSPPFARTGTGTTHLPSSFSRRTCVGRSTVHGTVHSSSCLPLHPLSSRWIQMEAGGNCAVVYSTLPRSSRSCAEGTLPGNYQVGRSHPVPEQSCSRARARIICQPSQAQRLSTGTNTLLSIPSDQTETRISIRQNQGFPPCPGGSDKPRAVSSTPSPIRHSAHLSGSPGPVAVRSRVPVSFLSGQDAAGQTRAPNPVLAPPAQRAPPKRNTLAPLPTQLSYIFYLLASSSPALPRLGSFFVFFFLFFLLDLQDLDTRRDRHASRPADCQEATADAAVSPRLATAVVHLLSERGREGPPAAAATREAAPPDGTRTPVESGSMRRETGGNRE